MDVLDRAIADAVLGIDTLWGGDVMNPSGTGRFIADSWFSDEPLPAAYTTASAARMRESGGVGGKPIDREAVEAYLRDVNLPGAIEAVRSGAATIGGLRGKYLAGLATSLEVMWDLAMELLGKGPAVPYARCVQASSAIDPEPSQPESKRERVAELLAAAGYSPSGGRDALLLAVDAWRKARNSPMASVKSLGAAVIAQFDNLTAANALRFLPKELHNVPRANIEFLSIKDAWFSGSMNYVGRARNADGSPKYEATYEINASLQISFPEFQQLVSHEVVPGHVTTFAYLQNLYHRGQAGFEATVLTMNTRAAALFEGIANNAILIAHGVTEVEQLPDEDMQIGVLLALLQDDAKNQSSYLTWGEQRNQTEVANTLRREFLVSEERGDKLSGAWGQHPLLGRMYLPAYRAGTDKVAKLRREHSPEKVLPAIYGCRGLVDVETVNEVLAQENQQ
ncbi:hypothetical protein Acid345_2436 [Candidatus Koribacter versatilis Ellin345]|uniref:DUF885 domain-containing protein n=1 Tax=Koribacter versatilis (strain Ellin345) TaxID=204669 RepID=Q1INW3_KORVE|nr:hypothetical protein [Candidatus Koribacter versatilis]ABF41437.1 hypothetical protein Acid345_2436 [Candidatus Koribacter versatilis Ellin345]